MKVTNVSQTRESFHVQRRVVTLEPGETAEVARMTEPELAFLVKTARFSLFGSVDTFRYKNFRDITEKGIVSFGEEAVAKEEETSEPEPVEPAEPEEISDSLAEEVPEEPAVSEVENVSPEEEYARLMSKDLTLTQVRVLAKERGVTSTGTREEVAQRIADLLKTE